jgi:ribosomal protein S12 methylthiotransferase accessory factor
MPLLPEFATAAPPQWRTASSADMLGRAKAVAEICGITRLADITQLDELALPVWQAVRPMSRSLSVHQGKGWSMAAAQIGGLMEAIESHHAETYVPVDHQMSVREAMQHFGLTHMDDFLTRRSDSIDADVRLDWAMTTPLGGSIAFPVPSLCASLDFTTDIDSGIERNSNGLSGGACLEDALLSALCEVLERDAASRVHSWSTITRAAQRLLLTDVEAPWVQQLQTRLHALNLTLLCWNVSSWAGLPCFQARLSDLSPLSMTELPASEGWCCHPLAEVALSGAILEAIQSRLTYVAGARDDIEDMSAIHKHQSNLYISLEGLTPVGVQPQRWADIASWPMLPSGQWLEMIYERLHRAGFQHIGYLNLTQPHIGIIVVKIFVPGLGLDARMPRLPS